MDYKKNDDAISVTMGEHINMVLETSDKSLDIPKAFDDKKSDAEIIHELVLQKYKPFLEDISGRHHHSARLSKRGRESFGESIEDKAYVIEIQEPEVGFDEQKFLESVLGNVSNDDQPKFIKPVPPPQLCLGHTESSIGTDDISLLISRSSFDPLNLKPKQWRRSGTSTIEYFLIETHSSQNATNQDSPKSSEKLEEPLYTPVRKPKKPKTIKNKDATCSMVKYPTYEKIVFDGYANATPKHKLPTKEEEEKEILKQSETNAQAKKALEFGMTQKNFIGTPMHLELEKILLLSGIKLLVLKSKIKKEESQTMYDKDISHGCVSIKNLKIILNHNSSEELQEFYMCILKSSNTVFASRIVTPNQNCQVLFEEEFVFNNLPYDFQIDIFLYALKHTNESKKPFKCDLCIDFGTSLSPLYPKFYCLGAKPITVDNLADKVFLFEREYYNESSNVFEADICYSVSINTNLKGFLTIGTERKGCPLWNKRWCVLEGFILKYYYCPSDEEYNKPLRIINLKNCPSKSVDSANMSLCSRPRTLLLQIVKNDVKVLYYLSADNDHDLNLWKKQLNGVLSALSNWRLK